MGAFTADKLARYLELIEEPGFLELLCQRLACGETLSDITRTMEVPYSKVMYWLMDDDARYEAYRRALVAQSRYEVDEALRIADDAAGETEPVAISAAKLRVETRFKRAKHHAPKEYGDAQQAAGLAAVKIVLVDFRKEGGRVIEGEMVKERVAVSEDLPARG